MTVPTGTVTRFVRGNVTREDLSDVIELIAQEDTPYTSNIGRGKMDQTFHEWNTDSLTAVNQNNQQIEGDDAAANDTRAATDRVGDFSQIMRKVVGVSGTLQAINTVGGQKTLARELMKSGRELKLDREWKLVSERPAVQGAAGTAREFAGFGCWIFTNTDRGASGTAVTYSTNGPPKSGWPSASGGDGTDRPFTEAIVKNVMQACYAAGGKPRILMVPPNQKVVASTFPGIAVNRVNLTPSSSAATIIGTADVYKSDFGDLSIVPNPQMATSNAWFVDPEQAELMTLRAISTQDLAKTGDNERRLMIWEGTHKVNNQKAHGGAYDLS